MLLRVRELAMKVIAVFVESMSFLMDWRHLG